LVVPRTFKAFSPLLRHIASYFGAILIVSAILFYDSKIYFPGWYALLPVVGTCLVILSGENASFNRIWLSRRVLVGIGLISYPLYLWHWPLLSFAHVMESGQPSTEVRFGAVLASFFLAGATHVWIERRIRHANFWPIVFGVCCGLVVVALAGLSAWKFGAPKGNATASLPLVGFQSSKGDTKCKADHPTKGEYCRMISAADQTASVDTVLLGDSHAEHIVYGLGSALSEVGSGLLHLGESGCPPILGTERFRPGTPDVCHEIVENLISYVVAKDDLKRVVLAFRSALTTSGVGFGYPEKDLRIVFRRKGFEIDEPSDALTDGIRRTLERLFAAKKEVWIVLQTPELGFEIERCVGRSPTIQREIMSPCAVSRSAVEARRREFNQIVQGLITSFPVLRVIDPATALCDSELCYGAKNGQILYRDDDHLNMAGSLDLKPLFSSALNP